MIIYADTSALLKLYLEEPRSQEVLELYRSAEQLSTSVVAYAEIRAGLARSLREGRVTQPEHDHFLSRLNRDWRFEIAVLDLPRQTTFRAGDLAQEHALRGFDAIHLASALALQEALDEQVTFSAFDDHLNDAAVACGLARV